MARSHQFQIPTALKLSIMKTNEPYIRSIFWITVPVLRTLKAGLLVTCKRDGALLYVKRHLALTTACNAFRGSSKRSGPTNVIKYNLGVLL